MYHTFTVAHDQNSQAGRRRSPASKVLLWSLIGLLTGVLAETAQAQIVINGVGSSHGRQFAAAAPITMCTSTPRPIHLRSGADDTNSNRHTWLCNVTYSSPTLGINFVNQPAIIRYSATNSIDAYTRLTGQNNTAQTAPYIVDTSTCGPLVLKVVGAITIEEYSNCTQQVIEPVHFGGSDVQAASFGQVGPTGTVQPDADDSTLSNETVAALPFALFINNGVRLRVPGGLVGAQLANLSSPQIEMIFRRAWRVWNGPSLAVTSDGVTEDTTKAGVTLCLHAAGPGTKAAFAQVKMVRSAEVVVSNNSANGPGGLILYFPTSTGVSNCIATNLNAIGYLPAESVVPNAHPIQVDGGSADRGGDVCARRADVINGFYDFWTHWRVIRRTAHDGFPWNNLIRVFAEASEKVANSLPPAWVAMYSMNVDKVNDAGPLSPTPVPGVCP